jgi:hypothetical protein
VKNVIIEKHQPVAVTTMPKPNDEDQIRCRAYEIYEARGREAGHDLEDWLLAESEVKGTPEEVVAA